jgi:hypothetical protein
VVVGGEKALKTGVLRRVIIVDLGHEKGRENGTEGRGI